MKWLALAIITGLTAGLLLMAATAEGKATRIPFTEECYLTPTSPGTWTFPDGNYHVRDWTLECAHASDKPQLVGQLYIVFNANLDATGSGPTWNTWRLEVEGGSFEGVSQGKVTGFTTPGQSGTFRSVGHGTGDYEGQQFFADGVTIGPLATATGYILVP